MQLGGELRLRLQSETIGCSELQLLFLGDGALSNIAAAFKGRCGGV